MRGNIIEAATRVFRSEATVKAWLHAPVPELGGDIPEIVLLEEGGFERVLKALEVRADLELTPYQRISRIADLIEADADDRMSEINDEVLWRSIEVFGDHDKAMHWLNSPCFELCGAFPVIMIGEAAGLELVMDTLESIEDRISATVTPMTGGGNYFSVLIPAR